MPGNRGCHYWLLSGEQIIWVTGWCHCKNLRIKFKPGDRLWSYRCSVCNLTLNILLFGIHFLLCFGNKSGSLFVCTCTPHPHVLCICLMSCDLVVSLAGIEQREPRRLFCATGSTVYIYVGSIAKVQNMLLLVFVGIYNLSSVGLKLPLPGSSHGLLGFPGLKPVLKSMNLGLAEFCLKAGAF